MFYEKNKKISSNFLSFEEKFDLFELKIHGVFVWKLIRIHLFREVTRPKKTMLDKETKSFSLFDYTRYSIFHNIKKVDSIFFENPRKILKNRAYIDPYTAEYIKKFEESGKNYLVIDSGYKGNHYEEASDKRKFDHSFYYDFLLRLIYLKRNFISKKKLRDLLKIEYEFNRLFNVKIDFKKIVNRYLGNFLCHKKKYLYLFKKTCCKEIFIVCSYGKEGLISAAQDLGINITEFQHGIMGDNHMGYHFPNIEKVHYFPDNLLLFGQAWSEVTALPAVNHEIIGFKNINHELKLKCETDLNKILIVSQESIGFEILKFAINVAQNNKNYKFCLKLHPKQNRSNLINQFGAKYVHLENLEIDDENNIYSLILESKVVIGVSSTSILEALYLGREVLLLDMETVEFYSFLIENNYVTLVDDIENLILDDVKIQTKKINKDYFYSSQSINTI